MRKLLFFFGIGLVTLTACGPSPEEFAFQTQAEATAIAANWTETPTRTPTSTSTSTPTITLTPTATATSTPTKTLTPTVTATSTPMPTPDYSKFDELECPLKLFQGIYEWTLEECRGRLLIKLPIVMYFERWRYDNPTRVFNLGLLTYPSDATLPDTDEERVAVICEFYPYSEWVIKIPESVDTIFVVDHGIDIYAEGAQGFSFPDLQVYLGINCEEILGSEN